jgi:hypothetical protein
MPDELVIRFQQRYVGKDPWIEITSLRLAHRIYLAHTLQDFR